MDHELEEFEIAIESSIKWDQTDIANRVLTESYPVGENDSFMRGHYLGMLRAFHALDVLELYHEAEYVNALKEYKKSCHSRENFLKSKD